MNIYIKLKLYIPSDKTNLFLRNHTAMNKI